MQAFVSGSIVEEIYAALCNCWTQIDDHRWRCIILSSLGFIFNRFSEYVIRPTTTGMINAAFEGVTEHMPTNSMTVLAGLTVLCDLLDAEEQRVVEAREHQEPQKYTGGKRFSDAGAPLESILGGSIMQNYLDRILVVLWWPE